MAPATLIHEAGQDASDPASRSESRIGEPTHGTERAAAKNNGETVRGEGAPETHGGHMIQRGRCLTASAIDARRSKWSGIQR